MTRLKKRNQYLYVILTECRLFLYHRYLLNMEQKESAESPGAEASGGGEEKNQESRAGDCDANKGASASDVPLTAKPTCIIVLGMAGSGKTSFVQVITISSYRSARFVLC